MSDDRARANADPVPNTPTKAMSKEDADKINGDLRKAWR